MKWIVWLIGYCMLWALAVLWSYATSPRINKYPEFEKTRDGVLVALALLAGGGPATGLFAIGLEANLGIGYMLVFAFGTGAVVLSALFIGEARRKAHSQAWSKGELDPEKWLKTPRPAWLNINDSSKLQKKVAALKDPEKLIQTVIYPSIDTIRTEALEKITDERILSSIARFFFAKARSEKYLGEPELLLCHLAVKRIADESLLYKIIRHTPNRDFLKDICKTAIDKISNHIVVRLSN